jgi:hypothetical protein
MAAIVAFFAWGNRQMQKTHARFQAKDVEDALAELVSPDAHYHDEWDLFLAWRIDDPYLESIRQQCLEIIRESPPTDPREDISEEGKNRIDALLRELRSRI